MVDQQCYHELQKRILELQKYNEILSNDLKLNTDCLNILETYLTDSNICTIQSSKDERKCIEILSRNIIGTSNDMARLARSGQADEKKMYLLRDAVMNLVKTLLALLEMIMNMATLDKETVWLPLVVYAASCISCRQIFVGSAEKLDGISVIHASGDKILQICQLINKSDSTRQLFENNKRYLVSLTSQNTTKEEWVSRSSLFKYVLRWIVLKLTFPHFGGDLLGQLLALVFPLVDDLNNNTQRLGIQVLHHIVKNVAPTELRWYQEPLLQVLQGALTSRTPDVLELTLSTLVSSLRMLSVGHADFTLYDRFFLRLLNDCSLSIDVEVRRILLKHIRPLVKAMGAPHSIHVVRYLQPLLKVILFSFERGNESVVSESLSLLQDVILHAWPRVSNHTEEILVGIIRLVALNFSLIACTKAGDSAAATSVFTKAKESLKLLHRLDRLRHAPVSTSHIEMMLHQVVKAIPSDAELSKFCTEMLHCLSSAGSTNMHEVQKNDDNSATQQENE